MFSLFDSFIASKVACLVRRVLDLTGSDPSIITISLQLEEREFQHPMPTGFEDHQGYSDPYGKSLLSVSFEKKETYRLHFEL